MSPIPVPALRKFAVLLAVLVSLMPFAGSVSALPQLIVTCHLDRSFYRPSDSVILSGNVSSSLGQAVSATVWIVAIDPDGNYVENSPKMSGSNGNFNDTFALTANAANGNYSVSVTASRRGYQNGNCQTTFKVSSTAVDFTISVDPSSASITRGQSANFTLYVSSSMGFNGAVTLSVENPPPGSTASFSTPQIIPTGVSLLTIATNTNTALGQYSINIAAQGGITSQVVGISLTVTAPFDFALSVSPTSFSLTRGSSAICYVTVTMSGSPTRTVFLTLLGGPPYSTSLFTPAKVNSNFTSILIIETTPSTPNGIYPFTISASSTGKTLSVTGSLTVTPTSSTGGSSFNITASPCKVAIAQGSKATYTLAVEGSGSQTVTLNVIANVPGTTNSFNTLSGQPPFTSTLTSATAKTTRTGSYNLIIAATNGGVSRAVVVVLIVTAPVVRLEAKTPYGNVEILSNSTLTEFTVNNGTINFKTGASQGTVGFCNATVPVNFLNGQPAVMIDGQPLDPKPVVTSNSTHYMIRFNYTQSSNQITIGGITNIPEFSDGLLTVIVTLMVAGLIFRKKSRVPPGGSTC